MTEVRKADPAARRQALVLVVFGAAVGAVLILAFERSRTPLREWLLSEPGDLGRRVRLALLLAAALLAAPPAAFAVYFWSLGTSVVQAKEFPPPGYRVVRDTRVVAGPAAVLRGRGLKALALGLVATSALLWLLLWRLAEALPSR